MKNIYKVIAFVALPSFVFAGLIIEEKIRRKLAIGNILTMVSSKFEDANEYKEESWKKELKKLSDHCIFILDKHLQVKTGQITDLKEIEKINLRYEKIKSKIRIKTDLFFLSRMNNLNLL
jgi:hypothetical protein